MPNQLQQERSERRQEDWDVEHVEPVAQPKAAELSTETDELLDEIDDLLEENAEQFVSAFIQQGGQ